VLGIGGGTFLVPFLVLVGNLRPVEAVGISLFCVIGTSVGGASGAIRSGRANVGLALLLEPVLVGTSVGASLLAQRMNDALLLALFACMMIGIAVLFLALWRRGPALTIALPTGPPRPGDGVVEEPGQGLVAYRPRRLPLLVGLIGLSGTASGLFGIGGGGLNVPILHVLGAVPLRAAAATSVLTMSVTGAAAGAVHLAHGSVSGTLVGASLLGVVPGSLLGAQWQRRFPEQHLRFAFAVLAALVAVTTLYRASRMP
jgi:uncharacterized membrane protein YfcA